MACALCLSSFASSLSSACRSLSFIENPSPFAAVEARKRSAFRWRGEGERADLGLENDGEEVKADTIPDEARQELRNKERAIRVMVTVVGFGNGTRYIQTGDRRSESSKKCCGCGGWLGYPIAQIPSTSRANRSSYK